jgi:predicted ATPase/DNA-binding XRE family transcriptional regulator
MSQGSGEASASSAFAALLRAHRIASGLTQEEFAARAGVGVRTLRDLERGRARPQRATVELLADALELRGTVRSEFTLAARRGLATDPMIEPDQGVNLPPAPVLIGRDNELANLERALRYAALVTLVGVAGVGKTSLGWNAAHRAAGRHPAGVAGVVVSEVSTEPDILATIATVFHTGRARDLPARLAGRPALLLIDAVERAADATSATVRWLRINAPSVRVIATGRHPIGIPGEYVWPVAPLEVPPAGLTELDEIARYPAGELFLDKLRRMGQIELGPRDAGTVGELVRRLGGVPLALELGAARSRILALPEILARYGDRVLDLSGSTPDGGTVSLRDAIAASYRLLEPYERFALRRLAQFRHRWSVELAEPLLGGADPGKDIVVLLDRLVGLGLISMRGTGAMRFRLIDMVRDFALEQSAQAGELAEARRRHAALFAQYSGRIAPRLVGGTMRQAIGALDDVASDLRAALVFAAAEDPVTGLELAARLPRWWRFRGNDRLGRDWLRRLLDDPRTAGADPIHRAWAQLGLVQLASEHGDGLAELPECEAALATFTEQADVTGQLAARNQLCILHQAYGNYEESRRHGEAVLALATRHGRTRDMVVAQNNLTWHEIRIGDLYAAVRRLSAVQRLAGEVGEYRLRALAHANLAEVARLDGRYADSVAIGRRAMALLEELGDPRQRRRVQGCVGLALAQSGRRDEARAILAELADDPLAPMLEAYLALAGGDRETATERFGAAAESLAGQHDVRDVVEALIGVAVATEDPGRRASVLKELDGVCQHSAVRLLPRERALLGR